MRHPVFFRRGFIATTLALSLLALVGLATVELMRSFAADARRTTEEQVQAQLRQLLTAGELQAATGGQSGSVVLPDSLKGATLLLNVQHSGETLMVDIAATLGTRHATERISLRRNGLGWEITAPSV